MAKLTISFLAALILTGPFAQAQYFDTRGRAIKNVETPTDPRIGWRPISMLEGDIYYGVGVLTAMSSREGYFCSASLFSASLEDSAPVYVLTNGHCVALEHFLESPTLVLKNEFYSGSDFFLSNPFFDARDSDQKEIPFKKIAYASLNILDIAIVETDLTLKRALQSGLRVYKLSKKGPKRNQKVFSVGVPLVGMPKEKVFAYRSNCQLEEEVNLIEGPFKFENAWANNCSLVTGQSGSPIFNSSFEIIAIQATGHNGKDEGLNCALNRPCKVGNNGSLHMSPIASYSVSIQFISTCFHDSGTFDLNVTGCKLRKN